MTILNSDDVTAIHKSPIVSFEGFGEVREERTGQQPLSHQRLSRTQPTATRGGDERNEEKGRRRDERHEGRGRKGRRWGAWCRHTERWLSTRKVMRRRRKWPGEGWDGIPYGNCPIQKLLKSSQKYLYNIHTLLSLRIINWENEVTDPSVCWQNVQKQKG